MMMRKMLKRHRVIVTGDILTLNDDGDDDDNDNDDDDDDAYYDDKIIIFFPAPAPFGTRERSCLITSENKTSRAGEV